MVMTLFIPLKRKPPLNKIKNQFLQSPIVLFSWKIITVNSENDIRLINTLRGQNAELKS